MFDFWYFTFHVSCLIFHFSSAGTVFLTNHCALPVIPPINIHFSLSPIPIPIPTRLHHFDFKLYLFDSSPGLSLQWCIEFVESIHLIPFNWSGTLNTPMMQLSLTSIVTITLCLFQTVNCASWVSFLFAASYLLNWSNLTNWLSNLTNRLSNLTYIINSYLLLAKVPSFTWCF